MDDGVMTPSLIRLQSSSSSSSLSDRQTDHRCRLLVSLLEMQYKNFFSSSYVHARVVVIRPCLMHLRRRHRLCHTCTRTRVYPTHRNLYTYIYTVNFPRRNHAAPENKVCRRWITLDNTGTYVICIYCTTRLCFNEKCSIPYFHNDIITINNILQKL